jgi:uncharacterized membrane protein YheB (UPF0754 family)
MSIYIIPALTILTAWLAVSIPVYFIFNPKKPVNLLGIRIQGLLYSQWDVLGAEISRFISDQLKTNDLSTKLLNPSVLAELQPTIETHIDQFLRVKLLEKMPFLATFLGESTLAKLKIGMMEEIDLLLPEVIDQYINKSSSSFDVSRFITDNINKISIAQAEQSIKAAMSNKIQIAKMVGVFIGLIIGLIQIAIISL